jgi:hypothetical protein
LNEQLGRAGLLGTAAVLGTSGWLMGYPPGWLERACLTISTPVAPSTPAAPAFPPTETPSSRRSRKRSGGPG